MDEKSSYGQLRERMEEIVVQVRSKDIPLEKSLDLYEEALRLGTRCAELIDRTDFTVEELGLAADSGVSADADAAAGVDAASAADEQDEGAASGGTAVAGAVAGAASAAAGAVEPPTTAGDE